MVTAKQTFGILHRYNLTIKLIVVYYTKAWILRDVWGWDSLIVR